MSDEREECDFQAGPRMTALKIVWLKFMNAFDERFLGLGRAALFGADYAGTTLAEV